MVFSKVLDPWENSCFLASLTLLRSQVLLYNRTTKLCISSNTSMGKVIEGGVRLRRASVSAGKTFHTEVPTLGHEKKEDILEGRKNCGRLCTSDADSPRTPPVHTRIHPPPRKLKKKCYVFYCILKSFVDFSL